MGNSLIIKNANFSAVAVEKVNFASLVKNALGHFDAELTPQTVTITEQNASILKCTIGTSTAALQALGFSPASYSSMIINIRGRVTSGTATIGVGSFIGNSHFGDDYVAAIELTDEFQEFEIHVDRYEENVDLFIGCPSQHSLSSITNFEFTKIEVYYFD